MTHCGSMLPNHLRRLGLTAVRCLVFAALVLSTYVLMPSSPAHAIGDCAAGNVCVYADANFENAILRIPAGFQGTFWFPDSSKNKASSWINNSGIDFCARNDLNLRPDEFLFRLFANNYRHYVGDAVNDRADYVYGPCPR